MPLPRRSPSPVSRLLHLARLTATAAAFAASLAAATPDTTRPWTRWWWPGNAVSDAGITAQLEAMAAAGLGGVEITPP